MSGAVIVDGEVVGVQDLMAANFTTLRSVTSGSWIGRRFQGRGYGKEMRAAILHFAFEGLGALEAHSGAFWDNHASLATSRALGYQDNGTQLSLRRGVADRQQKLLLPRTNWEQIRRDDISIIGLEACRSFFVRETS